MLSFETDEQGDWLARLDCGHRRHIRHRPPIDDYPWIADPAARASKLGAAIECDRCGRRELPTDAVAYRTLEFDQTSLPAGLRGDHNTRAGVWARVDVLSGRLRFVMPVLAVDDALAAGEHVIVPPELVHHVEPLGPVRLRVTFLRAQP